MNSAPKINKLDRKKQRRVEDWCSSKKDFILTSHKTRADLAILASTDLSFPVTTANINSALDVLDISPPQGLSALGPARSSRTRTLAKCLHTLYNRLGESVPPELDDLLK